MANAIEVARCANTVFVRVSGLGNFNNASAFREYVEGEIQQGARHIIIDMHACTGLDSTFMGTIMGFVSCPLTPTGDCQNADGSEVEVIVVNSTPQALRAMLSLSLDVIVKIREAAVQTPDLKLRLLDHPATTPQQRVRLIREAHENLVQLDAKNEKIFAPFLKMLLDSTAADESR